MLVQRLPGNPLITPDSHPSLDSNINGPSLIRVPDWVSEPLGRYYLYFAHHQGHFIRLAYADEPGGPYTVHEPGALHCRQTPYGEHRSPHIASPDVHVDAERQQIRMYYHGCPCPGVSFPQSTSVAVSPDGLDFQHVESHIAASYVRAFTYRGWTYAFTMQDIVRRSPNGIADWEDGPKLVADNVRHFAVRVLGDTLDFVYTLAGDAPERLLHRQLDLRPDWRQWRFGPVRELLRPEESWEGAQEPLRPSRRGAIHQPAHQLRDPAFFHEDNSWYLLYSVAGERGIAIAALR